MAYTFKHGDRPLEGLTVQRAVGRGGFGEVYYAVADSGKQVALKYLRENPEIELRGIAHVMNLKSPYLITIYDVKRNEAGEPFVIMEYVSGPSLREMMLAEGNGMPAEKVAFLLKGIAKGLSYLHERGIVHRDLKPANIFYDDGYVKIGDYGLSKHMSVSKHSGQTVSVGTVHYMAPEIGSGSYTKAIDIYALGVILYEMLTGRLPFSGSSMGEVLMRHLRDDPDLSGVSRPFAQVIAKALAKDPNDRYQDAEEMLAAVMESADISAGMASFDASALTQVPRVQDAADPDQTVTSPAPRPPVPPTLDVHEQPESKTFQFIQNARANVGKASAPLPTHVQRKLDRFAHKLDHKAAKLERRFGRRGGWKKRHAAADNKPRINRKPQIFVLLTVTVMIALVLSLLAGGGGDDIAPRTVALAMLIGGGTVGSLLVHLRFLRRSPIRKSLFDRLAYASISLLFMLPVIGIADEINEHELAAIIVAPLAVLVLCNWGRRIEQGRTGKVDGWAAFWPAVIGAIAAGFAGAEEFIWIAAGVCAAMSLMTQAAAAMWPLPRGAGVPAS
ncbi:MAG: serine/threonine protein kinase, partial [Phycisphaerae bacterium]|nr:serine/threonine protein kinase [Phycisphaerae bacterium]